MPAIDMFISLRIWLKMVSDPMAVSTLINLRVLSGIVTLFDTCLRLCLFNVVTYEIYS